MEVEFKPLLSIKQAAALLNLKESRLRYEVFMKRMPHHKIGRSIRFQEDELKHWVQTKKVPIENG